MRLVACLLLLAPSAALACAMPAYREAQPVARAKTEVVAESPTKGAALAALMDSIDAAAVAPTPAPAPASPTVPMVIPEAAKAAPTVIPEAAAPATSS